MKKIVLLLALSVSPFISGMNMKRVATFVDLEMQKEPFEPIKKACTCNQQVKKEPKKKHPASQEQCAKIIEKDWERPCVVLSMDGQKTKNLFGTSLS